MEQLVVGAAVIAAWVRGHRCIAWTLLGVATGCAAYAQDTAVPASALGGSEAMLLELLRAGGLPAVLGFVGWMFSRGGIPVVLRLSDEDRKLLEELAEERDREDERRSRR